MFWSNKPGPHVHVKQISHDKQNPILITKSLHMIRIVHGVLSILIDQFLHQFVAMYKRSKDVYFLPDLPKLLPFLTVFKYASLYCYYTDTLNSIDSEGSNMMAKLYLCKRKNNDNFPV